MWKSLLVLGASATWIGCHDGGSTSPDLGEQPDLAPLACDGVPGDQHGVAFESGGETRYYFLHVPSDYRCDVAWPLLVDFHGTGSGDPLDPVEESWAFDEMITAADAEHFIVVRPRSRYASNNGQNVFQWDINKGDPLRNRTFATELIASLSGQYHIDPARVYAAGFSNGPSQALQFLAVDPPLVHGYMIVSGGLNAPLMRDKALTPADGRVYVSVGYRDYMWSTTRAMLDFLSQHQFDEARLWQRESNTGHELYGWNYREAFAWLDRGERSATGTLATGWQIETVPDDASITAMAIDPSGAVHAAGQGAIYRREGTGTWSRTATLGTGALPPHINGLCFLDDGKGVAVGESTLYTTTDGKSWGAGPSVTDFGNLGFSGAYLNGVACAGKQVVGAGLWTSATSDDGGATWDKGSMPQPFGGEAFVTSVRRSTQGTFVATGYYDYLGRSTDGKSFVAATGTNPVQWWNDVTSDGQGHWWAVGEAGALAYSSDDGVTFATRALPTTEDLYAVGFANAQTGLVVGAHGTALVTHDAGATWSPRPSGLDGYLGAVTWLDATTVLVAGERGTILRATP